jgi:transcriptional regulator with XRE-family HTH domain
MSKYTELLKDRVKPLLSVKGMSQNDLARRIGASSADVSDWLSGKVAIRFEKVCAIAGALDLEPWELLKPEGATLTAAESKPAFDDDLSLLREVLRTLAALNGDQLRSHLRAMKAELGIDDATQKKRGSTA